MRVPQNTQGKSERLAFAAPAVGSERIAAHFRKGILSYLVPIAVGLAVCYQLIAIAFSRPSSPFALLLLAMCGLSFGLTRLGKTSAAVATFTIGAYFTLLLYSLPVIGQSSGLATGAAYTFCMFPLITWMSYASRPKRLVAVALTFIGLTLVFFMGQELDAEVRIPEAAFTLAYIRTLFIVLVALGAARVVDISVSGFSARNEKALAQQARLNDQLKQRQQDLSTEAASHKRTLADLSRSESRFRHLFDQAFDGIIIYDGDAQRPIEMNSAFVKRLGWSRGEIESRTVVEMSPEYQSDGRTSVEVRAELVTKLNRGESLTYDWLHLSKGGGVIDYEVTTFTLPNEGNIRVSVFKDMTEKRLAEQKLVDANRELTTFAHAASHDLKEPLRTMSNFAKLIDRRYKDILDDSGREYLGFIMDAASRGTTLVQDLLEYAELGTNTPELKMVDMTTTAITVKQTVDARLREEGATLTIGKLPEVVATPTWTRQLLQNLISNALKFQRPGVKPEVIVDAVSNALGHEIRVKDNGIGIAPEDLERVFGVFQRLVKREEYEGNGIGLALCRRIMQKVEGDIRVESVLGEGTTFILWFPNHGMLSSELVDATAVSV